jgi:RNA polymerase sigma-70 factor (ECF subfamily)
MTVTSSADMASSFDEVAEQLTEPLRRYLSRYLGDAHLAEDVLQESLMRISRGLSSFEGRSSLKTWAFSVTTRAAIDHLRKSKADSRIVEIDETTVMADDSDDVDERIVIKEMNSCIRQEIDTLPEDYRAAILLHDLEGLTAAEVAVILDCSLATAKIRIHRGRARLKKVLQRDCSFYRDDDQVLRCDRRDPAEEI